MADLNLGQLITTTGRKRSKKLQDQVADHRPFTAAMKENGGIKRIDGGRTVVEEFSYVANPNAGWIPENGEVSLQQVNFVDAAEYPWYHGAGAFVLGGAEIRKNSGGGDTKYIDIASAKMDNLEETLMNIFHGGVISAGTASNQLSGIGALVDKSPATGQVGGIDTSASAAAFFRNFDFDTAADWSEGAVDAANILRFLDKLMDNTVLGVEKRFGMLGATHWGYAVPAVQAFQRTASGDESIGSKHQHIMYRGVKWYFGGGVNFSGQSQQQADLTYLLAPGPGKLEIVFHKDAEFEFLEPVNARNQDAISRLMILMVTMTVNRRRLQAVGYDS